MDAQELEVAAFQRGVNPLLKFSPARRKRWNALTEMEALKADMEGYTATGKKSMESKRLILEGLLDNHLRVLDRGDGNPDVLDMEAIPHRYREIMQFLEQVESKKQKLEEADSTGTFMGWTGSETSAPATGKIFTTQSLGIIRRVFPKLIATDLVAVQPMSQPTGKAFYLDFQYANAGNGSPAVDAGDSLAGYDDYNNAGTPTFSENLWAIDRNSGMPNYGNVLSDGSTDATVDNSDVDAREIKLDIRSADLVARTKKLATDWSVETDQDLRAYQGLSADDELMTATSAEMTREIDREILEDLYYAVGTTLSATHVVNWPQNGGYSGSVPSEQQAALQTLYDAIEDAAAYIEKRRYVRPTWVLTNVAGATRLRKLNGFRAATTLDPAQLTIGMGARRIFGTVQDQFVVYVDPWFRKGDTYPSYLLGYKGAGMMEAGYVYAPYVSMYRSPLWQNPKTFKNSRGVMSRYAKKLLVAGMYALVKVTAS